MKSISIAGGAGFIGWYLTDRLLRRGDVARLLVVNNLWTGLPENLVHMREKRSAFTCASPALPPWSVVEPERSIPANLIVALRRRDLLRPGRRFGSMSTSEAYGDALVTPQPESNRGSVDCTSPRSSYDDSNGAESSLFERRRLRRLNIRVVRLFNVYGKRSRADDGIAVSDAITQARPGRRVTVYGTGVRSRLFGVVDDVIDALERFFRRDAISDGGKLNVGNDREGQAIDIARFIRALVLSARIVHSDPPPHDPTNRCLHLTIARRVLPGWNGTGRYEDFVRRRFNGFAGQIAASSLQHATRA